MPHIITHYLPELNEPERSFLTQLTAPMSEANVQQFAIAYRTRRKDPQTVCYGSNWNLRRSRPASLCVGPSGYGFLYLFTGGLLLIGTIADIVKHKELAFNYNRQVARRIASNLEPEVTFGNGSAHLQLV